MADFLTLKSVDDILAMVAGFSPLGEEAVPLDDAAGRVLANAFAAPHDLPGFDRSAMDGYAVRARDVFGATEGLPALLDVAGEIPMGRAPAFAVAEGQTARIWTGGMLPDGADAVVMLEYSRPAGQGRVELSRPAAPGDNVVDRAEDAREGEELLPAGRKLRPEDIGLLAAFGVTRVGVGRPPAVAVISSGDEVVPAAAAPRPGEIRDINAHALCAFVRAAGGRPRSLGIAGDSVADLRRLVDGALEWADVVLLSGGSSAGRRDFTARVFSDVPGAELLAHGVAISPGKPLILARRGGQSLWGLPGHAASALVTAEVFLRPLLGRLQGRVGGERWRGGVRAVLTRPIASAQGRRDYIRVRLEAAGEEEAAPLRATPLPGKSGLVTTLVLADGLVVCPENREGLYEGEIVEILVTDA